MKDTDEELHQSDRLLQEAKAGVRLILRHQEVDKYLLARYPSLDDGRVPTYWSFIGVGPLRRMGNELSLFEMVVRVAYERWRITITDLDLVATFYDRRVTPPKVGRLYFLVREWKGPIPHQHDTENSGHKFTKEDQLTLSHEHFWVSREFLLSYFSHPELLAATRAWEEWEHKQVKGAGA